MRRRNLMIADDLGRRIRGPVIDEPGACSRSSPRRTARRRRVRRVSRWIRSGRSRCRTTGCSAPTIGVWVDERDHIWIIHRSSATLNNNEKGAELNPPTGECCKGAPPVLEFDAAGNLVGIVGRSRGRATSGRSRTTASSSTTRATSGSAAMARAIRTSSSSRAPGKFIAQYGKAGVHKGAVRCGGPVDVCRRQQRSCRTSAASPRSSSTRATTRPTSRTGI